MYYKKLKREIQTVGVWYLATFIADILANYKDLQDVTYKQNFILKLQSNAAGGDISLDSTTSKVNAMLRIVKAGKSREVLSIIVEETNPRKVPKGTIECARGVLQYIEEGKIPLPK